MNSTRSITGRSYGAKEPTAEKRAKRAKEYVALRISPELLERIKERMRSSGMTKQDVCIEAIERGLER